MTRLEWYCLYREVRTPCIGPNLFRELDPEYGSPASIALEIAQAERKEKWREVIAKKYARD